jgi:hypothetical protein
MSLFMRKVEPRHPLGVRVISGSGEKGRTVFAVVAASVISLVVWGLVVALNVR